MNDTFVSFIRTWVPILIGSVLAWLSTVLNLTDVDTTGLTIGLTGLVIAGYYGLVRVAEQKWPWVGVFLGKTTQPAYANTFDIKEREYTPVADAAHPDDGGYIPPVH